MRGLTQLLIFLLNKRAPPSKLAELFTPIDLCPVKFSKLSNGINSNVYKVVAPGELYVLKLFLGLNNL